MSEDPSYSSGGTVEKRSHGVPARSLWLTLFVVAGITFLAGSYAYYRHETDRIRQQRYDEIAAIASLKVGHILQWEKGLLSDVRALSTGPLFRRGLGEWLRDPKNEDLRKDLTDRLVVGRQHGEYDDAVIVDLHGNVLLEASRQPEPINAIEKEAIQEALTTGSPVLSNLYRDSHGVILIDALAPILDREGRPIAVGLYRSNAESLLYPLIQSWPTPSRTAETLLVRKDGDELLFLNNLRHRPGTALSLREPLTQTDLPAVQAVLGKQGMFLGKDYRGVEVLADLGPIPNSRWFIVAKVDTSEILAEARYRGSVIALFAALFVLLAGAVTAYGYRYRQIRLYQDLYLSERNQRDAEEQFRTILYSIGDAVISTDTGGLVKQMNPVAETLTGWLQKEAVGRPLEDVFRIINEQTRQPCENPVQKVLKNGLVVGLANHTVLIGRDGTERVLADSGAPIRTEDGEILGVVLVFRDVTERARAAEELRKREGMLRAILAASPVGIILTQDRRIKWANDSWVRMFGFASEDEYLDQPSSLMHPSQESYGSVREILYAYVELGQVSEADASLKRKDGTLFDGHIRANLVDASDPSKGTISAISDISEKKKAEQDLRESEGRHRLMFSNMPAGVAVYETEDEGKTFVFRDFNSIAEEISKVKRDEVVGKNLLECFPKMEEFGLVEALRQAWKTGIPQRIAPRYYKDERREGWRDSHIYKLPSGEVVEIYQDVTEQVRTYEQLRTSEEKYRNIFEGSRDAIYLTARDGTLVGANQAFLDLFGFTREEARDLNILAIYSDPTDRPRFQETIEQHGSLKDYEVKLKKKDGTEIECLLTFTLRADKDGNVLGYQGIARDITERKCAEESLRESEEKYRTVVENMQDVFYRTDMEGTITMVSPSGPDMIGYESVDEIVGLNVSRDFYKNAEERDRMLATLRDKGRVHNYEVELVRKDGNSIIVSTSSHVYYDKSGKPLGVEGVFTDITDRKRAEEALKESEKRHRDMVEKAHDVIYRTDANGFFILFNPVGLRITGYSLEEISHKHYLDLIHPDYKKQVERFYELQLVKRIPDTYYEVPIISRQGEKVWIGQNVQLVMDGDTIVGFQSIARDITDRKQAELALKASEIRYRRLFEAAKDGILILDADTAQIVDVNPFLTGLLGYSQEELMENKLWEIGIFEDTSKCQALFLELQSKEYVRYEDLPLQKKGGSTVEVEFVSNVYQVNGKKVIQCNIRDVTDRKRLERQLLQSQKMEAVGILAGGVAHDFNNILTVVQGFSELLLMEMDEKAPDYSDLQKIHEAGRRGAELVRNLLAFSRKAETKPRPINLNDEVARIQKLLSRTIPKMIKIELHLEGDLAAVNADPDQMGQVLMNLAVNSEHAMPDGGNLTVATANISLDEEFCRSYTEMYPGNYVLLTVSDTGHGMDKETLGHIFEPFFTTKGVGKGTGLGLSMVYGIIRQHGGQITCYSEPNHGTTFKIYLPAVKEEGTEREAEAEQELPRCGTETILLVDDENFIRDLGARFLTRAGYTVINAASGPEAVKLYLREGERISLIILDLIMPEMGGDKCLEEILAINPEAKIIISSGAAVQGKKKETLESGAKGFVSKPFQLRDMLKTVREVLDSE